MGFRDLRAFNLALLAKQGWRLLQNEDSLLFKIFKARYFPRCSFLDAKIVFNPSFAWRSILEARPVLEEGLKWRIGNGAIVKIWGDSWLPGPGVPKISSPPCTLPSDGTVSLLIDGDTGWWKVNLVRAIFDSNEAEQILSIPLSYRFHMDSVMWTGNSNGCFIVKSAYHVARRMRQEQDQNSDSRQSIVGSSACVWKAIWSCSIPNKVKVFAWRACKNVLPSFDNLAKRGVVLESICQVCHACDESINHILRDCVWAGQVWRSCPFFDKLSADTHLTIKEWLELFITSCGTKDFGLLLVILWKIWYNRNIVVHGGTCLVALNICPAAADLVTQYNEANMLPLGVQPTVQTFWLPPPQGLFKLNCDGAMFFAERASGVWCCNSRS